MRFRFISFFVFLSILFSQVSTAQIYDPVNWSFTSVEVEKGQYDLIFKANIKSKWSIYSQFLKEDGPIPTSFDFEKSPGVKLVDKSQECDFNKTEGYDKVFDMNLIKYKKKAYFVQRVTANASKKVSGWLEFMTCDDTKCLPPAQIDFVFDLSKSIKGSAINYDRDQLCNGKQSFKIIEKKTLNDSDNRTKDPRQKVRPKDGVVQKQTKKDVKQAVKKTANTASETANTKVVTPKSTKPEVAESDEKSDKKIQDPVSWKGSITKNAAGLHEVKMKAKITEGWNIYSINTPPDDGPIPTTLFFNLDEGFDTIGAISESAEIMKTEKEPLFDDIILTKLKKNAEIKQTISIDDDNKSTITGFVEYMTCDERGCIFPDPVPFYISPDGSTLTMGMFEETNGTAISKSSDGLLKKMFGLDVADLQNPVGDCVREINKTKSLFGIFILGLLGGLVALLTPCVFPMIPLTVSFFTKGSEDRGKGILRAIIYGVSIFAIYILLSAPFHVFESLSPTILNDISTNVWLNLAFFAIFIFFALSFFGYYDLELPSSVSQRVSAAEGVGGFLGIFFMALTLAIVSFSCTGPILGSLLAGTLQGSGGAWQLTAGMAGFGVALGLPFGLFAAFPSMMNKLPKSGGWLNVVKVVLGFLELALAFKFLSNADLVKQWGILKIEPFLIIWILIFLGLALYLIGKIKFPHDSPLKKLGIGRISLAALSFAFVVYLATGFKFNERAGTYDSLSLLSGMAPPVCYSLVYDCKCPQGLDCYKDLNEGLAYAKSVNKPVMIDFTGHACINCRKMEENVWPTSEVFPYLEKEYVLISLYVDEKLPIPEDEQVIVERKSGGKVKLDQTGRKWAFLQTEYFGTNAQPLYVLMTADGKLLNNPAPYTPDPADYAAFLECGLENFRKMQ